VTDIVERIEEAFRWDTFWDTDAPPLLRDAVDEIKQMRLAIRRLAEQDATLSVCDGNVTVTLDATLTDEERAAIGFFADIHADDDPPHEYADTLRLLLESLA